MMCTCMGYYKVKSTKPGVNMSSFQIRKQVINKPYAALLKIGSNLLKIEAIDKAGNVTVQEITVKSNGK